MRYHHFHGELLSEDQIADRLGCTVRAIQKRAYRLRIGYGEAAERGPMTREGGLGVNRSKWDGVDVERFIELHPDGADMQEIAEVLGITRQGVDAILKGAFSKLAKRSSDGELEELWTHVRTRGPTVWQQIIDDAPGNGNWQSLSLYGREKQTSVDASPSDYTRRVDEAIARLERAADRALYAALTQRQDAS